MSEGAHTANRADQSVVESALPSALGAAHAPTHAAAPSPTPEAASPSVPVPVPMPVPTLQEPTGGVPPICQEAPDLLRVTADFAAGSGPVALDAERASGHRYGQRAFLIQAKRAGSGIALIDPQALPDLTDFAAAIADEEWVLHSATQDLPCLTDLGLRPRSLFDTELAARLLDLPRVGLASLTETLLGWHLAKGHSAADWSIRPLPDDYLRYAALDVELLLELRENLHQRLVEDHKWQWAQQEFAGLLQWAPKVRVDPWRRTSGSHRLRQPRQLAVLRAVWQARDEIARELDLAPGRVLPDAALVAAAEHPPASPAELLEVPGFKRQRRRSGVWFHAIREAMGLPRAELPPLRVEPDGPPNPRSWPAKDPSAAERFHRFRAVVLEVARDSRVPAEVLISPDTIRRLAWTPPQELTAETVAGFLLERGARAWQVEHLAVPLAETSP